MRLHLPGRAAAWLMLALGAAILPGQGAVAQSFAPPGLSRDAEALAQALARRAPAGASLPARAAAEARATAAEAARDWAAAATAWEQRLGMPEPAPRHWLGLARALLAREPADPARASQAAWQAYDNAPDDATRRAALQEMARAFRRREQWLPAIGALEAILESSPEDATTRAVLQEVRQAAGLLLAQVRTEPEAEPARACLSFAGTLSRAEDFRPGDWVRAEPPLPDLAVTREEGQLCLAGLPWGQVTTVVLRAGLPGEDGIALRADLPVRIAMPDRAPRILFDATRFVLPRGQVARVGVAALNIRRLKLRLVRVEERNLRPFARQNPLGQPISGYSADDAAESWGRTVWTGTAELPEFRPNTLQRLALPLPAEITTAGPGLYVLLAAEDVPPGAEPAGGTAGLQIVNTDLGLTAWRGPAGLAAQLRMLGSAEPKPGARVALMARNNEILAEESTDAQGLVRFPAPLLRGTGPMAPVALHAREGDDLVALDLEQAAFDLSDRGAGGLPHPGPLDAFLWLDRGIYRPGEVVNLTALLRDAAGRPQSLPLRLRLRRPNGQVAAEAVLPAAADGALSWPVTLPPGASAGSWRIEALVEPDQPPIAGIDLRVDAFVPDRMAVTLGPAPGPLVPGQALPLPVSARFLYGAPAAGLEGTLEGTLGPDPEPFAPDPADGGERRSPWRGWQFGMPDEPPPAESLPGASLTTDADGKASVALSLPRGPDATRPQRASLTLSLSDPNGHASLATLELPVRSATPFLAIRPEFSGGSVDANAEAAFQVALVSPDGAAMSGRLEARLVRERPEWRVVTRGRLARYETVWRDEPVDQATLTTTAATPARFTRTLPFGRYRLEVTQPGGLAIAALRFRSGWVGADSVDVPDKLDVAAARPSYAPGETARLRIEAPFAGHASLAVLTDGLVSLRELEVPEGGTEVELPVDAAWGPGAHVAVTLFRPGAAAEGQPRRALGLAWVALDPAPRQLQLGIEAPARVLPRQRVEVAVRVAAADQPVHLTLAAVDEGVLRLTGFPSPDPVRHFLGRRRLGTDIRDDYGRLIPPPEGLLAALRQGGDAEAGSAITPPQRVVSLFSGIVAAGPDGVARVPLDLPDFAGELRLMAVAWSGNRVGSAERPLTVRDPLVGEALLPRFLAPGDTARLPLLLHNLELPAGEVSAEIALEGPLALDGPARFVLQLAQGQRAEPATILRATGAGEGVIRLRLAGPGGFAAERESRITIRSARSPTLAVSMQELAPGAEARIAPDLAGFVPGTVALRGSWGLPVRYDATALLRALAEYPMSCAEQSASRVLALATAGGAAEQVPLGQAISALLDRQRYDGAFGLWSSGGEADPWVSAYAAEALLRARAVGATVPKGALQAALEYLAREAGDASPDTPEDFADQAYRLHVLALAGRGLPGATRRLALQLDQLPTPLSRAQLGAALTRLGDAPRAAAAFEAATQPGGRRPWFHDYGSAARDSLAVTLLLREAGFPADRLAPLLARLPAGPDMAPAATSTQEQAWAVALAAALGRDAAPVQVALDGRPLPPAPVVNAVLPAGGATARNASARPVMQAVALRGLPVQPPAAARAGLRLRRQFFRPDGTPLPLDNLHQNDSLILLLEVQAETGESHRLLVQHGLPAGWEIAARLPGGEQPGRAFLGQLSEAAGTAALDDRFAVAADVSPQQPLLRFAVLLRAVTPGSFELPGAEVVDMYRPGVFARQAGGRITILPP